MKLKFDKSDDCLKFIWESTYATRLRQSLEFCGRAFLSYWLSWYVPPSGLEDGLKPYVFPLAILIERE